METSAPGSVLTPASMEAFSFAQNFSRWHWLRVAGIEGLSLFQVGQFGQSRAFSSAINEWLAGIKKSAPVADGRKGVMVRIAQCDKIEMAVADSWSVAQLKICPRLPCNSVKGVCVASVSKCKQPTCRRL